MVTICSSVNRVFFMAPSFLRGRHSLKLQLVRKTPGRSQTHCASPKEPIPVWCELLDEAQRERAIAPPPLPEIHGMGRKFGRAVFGIFAEFKAMLLRTIEPEDDSL